MPQIQPIPDISVLLSLIIFGAGFLVTMLYYWVVFSRLAFRKPGVASDKEEPVSLVICTKNERHHLEKNLSQLSITSRRYKITISAPPR